MNYSGTLTDGFNIIYFVYDGHGKWISGDESTFAMLNDIDED